MKTQEKIFEDRCWVQVAASDISRAVTINGREMQGTETVTPHGVYFVADEEEGGGLYYSPWTKTYIQQDPNYRKLAWPVGTTRKQAIILHSLSRV